MVKSGRVEKLKGSLRRGLFNFSTFQLFNLLTFLFLTTSAFGGYTTVTDINLSGSRSATTYLSDKTVYRFALKNGATTASYSATGKTGIAPITVKSGVTAAIFIPKGVTVSLTGGDAAAESNAGTMTTNSPTGVAAAPAIEVEEGATLFVLGGGELRVKGGKAANGANGGPGTSGYAEYSGYNCGCGGTGGNGGGGGAAAIGGRGGRGGKGGDPIPTKWRSDEARWSDNVEEDSVLVLTRTGNIPGNAAQSGEQGGGCGRIALIGNDLRVYTSVTTAEAKGGQSCTYTADPTAKDKNGGWHNPNGGQTAALYATAATQDDYSFGAGGSGAGGAGGGAAPYGIGPGGGGGGGGGGGATGTSCWFDFVDDDRYPGNLWHSCGFGGAPGLGKTEASHGAVGKTCSCGAHGVRKSDKDTVGKPNRESKEGGAGGSYGNDGKNGEVYRYLAVSVSNLVGTTYLREHAFNDRVTDQWIRSAVGYTITFVDTWDVSSSYSIMSGCAFPGATRPMRTGFTFRGYYDGPNGTGTRYYDEDCHLVSEIPDCYAEFKDLTLYASWGREGGQNIVVEEGQTMVFDGQFDGRLAQPENGRLLIIARGGTAVLQNAEVLGNDAAKLGAILNEGTLVVSNCTFTGLNAPNGLGAVYSDRVGAKAVFYACTFRENTAAMAPVIAAAGSTVSCLHCTFLDNHATLAQNGVRDASAVLGFDIATLNILSCTFVGNSAPDATVKNDALRAERVRATNGHFENDLFVVPRNGDAGYSDPDGRAPQHGIVTTNLSSIIGARRDKTVGGVAHVAFRPVGKARTDGLATLLHRNEDWTAFSTGGPTADCPTPVEGDQFGQYPLPYWMGALNGNTLQWMINVAPEGGVVEVPPGTYDPVVVGRRVSVVGAGAEATVIDADGYEPCVTVPIGGEDAFFADFTFRNGNGASGCGGAWQGLNMAGSGIISNCTVTSCTATNGGAVAYAKLVSDCNILNCTAADSGGGTYGCVFVERTYYGNNTSGSLGGASARDGIVQSSLITGNSSFRGGAAADGSGLRNCTLIGNRANSGYESDASVYRADMTACLLYDSGTADQAAQGQGNAAMVIDTHVVMDPNVFADYDGKDYHLRSVIVDKDNGVRTRTNHEDLRVRDATYVGMAQTSNLLDIEHAPLSVVPPGGSPEDVYIYAGCYAYMPFKTHGLTVTGTASYYDNVASKTSLREAIEEARAFPFYAVDGEFRITFDPEAFASGTVMLDMDEPQVEVDVFTNATLVIAAPTNCAIVLNGGGRYRAFRVQVGNRLRTENLTFYNCRGTTEGQVQLTADGGAIRNDGWLMVTNCSFVGNAAGSRTGAYDYQSGYGGAIATMGGATSLVWRSSFVDNSAACGGALYVEKGSRNDIFFSTFAGNRVGTDAVGARTLGGAICAGGYKSPTDTLLVNCTVVGNRVASSSDSGGGIAAGDGLVLLNSIVFGNTSGGAADDVMAFDYAKHIIFAYTAYGVRSETGTAPNYPHYTDVQATRGCVTTNTLAFDDAVLAASLQSNPLVWEGDALEWGRAGAIPQYVLPLQAPLSLISATAETNQTVELPAAKVWMTPDGANVGFGQDVVTDAVRGSRLRVKANGVLLTDDQLGMHIDACLVGATRVSAFRFNTDAGTEKPGDDPGIVSRAVAEIIRPDGVSVPYATVSFATDAWRPGDTIVLLLEDDDSNEYYDALDELYAFFCGSVQEGTTGVIDAFLHGAIERDWFDFTCDDLEGFYSLTLNEKALPEVTNFDTSSVGHFGDRVSVSPGNVKPELWYALGYTGTLEEEFKIEKWIQASPKGELPALTAPAQGESGYYRIFVAPYVP